MATSSLDYPKLRYAAHLEFVRGRWLGIEAIGCLETPISGDDLARIKRGLA